MSSTTSSTNASGNQFGGNGGAAPCPIPSSGLSVSFTTSTFVHPWAVDSRNPTANRPDGKLWNYDFPDMKDLDPEICFQRVSASGGSRADADDEWRSQVDACSKTPMEGAAFENFQTALLCHEIGLNEEKILAEDEALKRKRTLEALKLEAASRRERQARGETAEMRALEAAATAKRLAATVAATGPPTTPPIGNTPGIIRHGNSAGNVILSSGNMKIYFTVDGTEVLTDKKEANAIIGNNLSLYRTVEPSLLKRMMDYSNVHWSVDSALLIVWEDRQVMEDKALTLQTDPHYALAFLAEVEGNPGFIDRIKLERLLRVQFRLTEGDQLHYLMFYPYVNIEGKIHDRKAHIECLDAIQKIWWIFFGDEWKFILRPLIDRLTEGDLVPIFRVSVHLETVQEVHYLVTHQIQLAFCMVASILRKNEPRLKCATPAEAKAVLIAEIQGIFERTVAPGSNHWANASRILEFKSSGKLGATMTLVQALKKKQVSTPTGAKKRRVVGEEDTPSEKRQKLPKEANVCLRNIMLQFFGKQDGLGDICNPGCAFSHTPVGQFNQATFDKAMRNGTSIFGDIFATGGWGKKLEDAYGGTHTNGRQRPILTPKGDKITPKSPAIGGGRGGGRGGRGRGRGNA